VIADVRARNFGSALSGLNETAYSLTEIDVQPPWILNILVAAMRQISRDANSVN